MIDQTMIKDHYSRMTDNQLLRLFNQDGLDLTSEAISILHEEFLNRKLDTTVFENLEEHKTMLHQQHIEKARDNALNTFIQSIWDYAFDEKQEGKSNESIHSGLMERGFDEDQSTLLIHSLENKATEALKAHQTDMTIGGLTFAAGLIITVLTYSNAIGGGTYFVAWGAIVFGIFRFFRAWSNTNKYKNIIANIQSEHDSAKTGFVESKQS